MIISVRVRFSEKASGVHILDVVIPVQSSESTYNSPERSKSFAFFRLGLLCTSLEKLLQDAFASRW